MLKLICSSEHFNFIATVQLSSLHIHTYIHTLTLFKHGESSVQLLHIY
jgi:hypothetical protein